MATTNKLTPSTQLLAFVKARELFRAKAYYPLPGDALTVGYGTTGSWIKEQTTVTEPEAERLLLSRLQDEGKFINMMVKVPLSQHQFDAIVSMCYNIGDGALAHSKALMLLNSGDYEGFCSEAFDPVKGFVRFRGKISSGLQNRRKLEELIFKKGIYVDV